MLLLIVLLPLLLGTVATAWLGSKSRPLTAVAAGLVTASALAVQGEEQGTTASAKGKLRYAIKGTDRAAG